MRVLLDSNILARATPGKTSTPREVLQLLLQPPHILVSATSLLGELARILQYPRVRALHGLDDAAIQVYLKAVQAGSVVVHPVSPPPVQTRDPDDDVVIAVAIGGQAEALCARDQHFFDPAVQSACAIHGLRIVNDVALLQELRTFASPQAATP